MPKSTDIVLAYDLGGTKVALAAVTREGAILREERHPVPMKQGKEHVLQYLIELGSDFIREFPQISAVGVASAGPLDPTTGELLDPHNFATPAGRWGLVPLGKILSEGLKRPAFVDNDAAAAILAEHWKGAASGYPNCLILTLGTGLGVGVINNGNLVRGGRSLHPEGGHILLKAGDPTAVCGCGNLGCAEAYLSGRNFGIRASVALGLPSQTTSLEISERARGGDAAAKRCFEDYAEWLAYACSVYVRLYYPEIIVLTGSFAHAHDLFLENARYRLGTLLKWNHFGPSLTPQIAVSTLDNRAGVLGGALIALHGSTKET